MATLALSVAGQVVGGLVGGPIGAMVGRALGALAGSAVDDALFGEKPQPVPAGADIRLTGSAEGGAIPRLYGWSRLAGNIIWATQLEEVAAESSGGKGSAPSEAETEILANFAVAFCEGPVAHLGRIWADGELLDTEGLTIRFYAGSETQAVDSLIEAKQGTGNAPAYRGTCYIVFEQLPLGRFGNRIPWISAEFCRPGGTLEPAITAVTVIPGATEFGYDPTPRVRLVSPGVTAPENAHVHQSVSDWTLSLDTLADLCPNLKHVSLVVAWFGDDLRAGRCRIRPKVEDGTRTIEGASWVVSGVGRDGAETVSTYEGGPAYGGTPSDGAVLAAIADLKARGIAVTLYPLLMMDIPAGNGLADPYGGAEQAAYPWRGRITGEVAPGRPGTTDRTAAAAEEIAAFLGTAQASEFTAGTGTVEFAGSEWSYRRMLLHYAKLAQMAGGVDALIIGSELRGLTTLRDNLGRFPFVDGLATLAADIRAMLGPETKLTYAADWSEYSGYQPADEPGAKYFHLDPLWASAAIDAVGIDNYMPIADWRDGRGHADAALTASPYALDYLEANIASGEGYDWYYASDADRAAGRRTPITDATHGEPWVWRFKDIVGWWSNLHHDRPGGVRNAAPTAWVPQSKPIWFTELGCGAIDKGANQPNVFGDPKSSESGRPYFSNGAPDPLMQRQVLRAHLGWWRPDAPGFEEVRNPVSSLYGGRMLDPDRVYLWSWDARPYPAFPRLGDVWRDAADYATGHWLTGRLGAAASDELIAAMAADYGIVAPSVQAARPLVTGLVIDRMTSLRDALDPLLAASGLAVRDRADGLDFRRPSPTPEATIAATRVVAADGPLVSRRRPDPTEAVARLAFGYSDRERDYLSGTVTAMRLADGASAAVASNLVLDDAEARYAAETELRAKSAAQETLEFALPPSFAALEVGDTLTLEGVAQGPFQVSAISEGLARKVAAQGLAGALTAAIVSDRPAAAALVAAKAVPLVWAAELPPLPETPEVARLVLAGYASPWPGSIEIVDSVTGGNLARLMRPATLGELAADLAGGPESRWDEANTVQLALHSGHLASLDDLAVLAGGNRIAVETDDGHWEIIGFAEASLVSPGLYRLSRLLRGQEGSRIGPAGAGRRVIVLDAAVTEQPLPTDWLEAGRTLTAFAGPADATGTPVAFTASVTPLLPLSPVHLRATRIGTDVVLSWVRRSRADTGSWAPAEAPIVPSPEAYTVSIFDGARLVRTLTATTPAWTYALADQTADFGGPAGAFTFTVAQISPAYGPGEAGQGAFNG